MRSRLLALPIIVAALAFASVVEQGWCKDLPNCNKEPDDDLCKPHPPEFFPKTSPSNLPLESSPIISPEENSSQEEKGSSSKDNRE